jgi:tRNA G18 (ribose-2'-O)-methylase SpoU
MKARGLELNKKAVALEEFTHPRGCVYLLGAEEHGLTNKAMEKSHHLVKFDTRLSINVSVAGSMIMYDRNMKLKFNGIN